MSQHPYVEEEEGVVLYTQAAQALGESRPSASTFSCCSSSEHSSPIQSYYYLKLAYDATTRMIHTYGIVIHVR